MPQLSNEIFITKKQMQVDGRPKQLLTNCEYLTIFWLLSIADHVCWTGVLLQRDSILKSSFLLPPNKNQHISPETLLSSHRCSLKARGENHQLYKLENKTTNPHIRLRIWSSFQRILTIVLKTYHQLVFLGTDNVEGVLFHSSHKHAELSI